MAKDLFNPRYKLNTLEKNFYLRRTFRYGVFKYGTVCFLAGGLLLTDYSFLRDDFNSRPDFNVPRMMTPVPEKEKKVFEIMNDSSYYPELINSSWIKRFKAWMFPSIDYKPSYIQFYDYKNSNSFPSSDISSYYSKA